MVHGEARPKILPVLLFFIFFLACYALVVYGELFPSSPSLQAQPASFGMFEELMLPERRPVHVLECEGGTEAAGKRWVVLYTNASDPSGKIQVTVYHREHHSAPSLLSNELMRPEGMAVCQCQCNAREEELLAGRPGKELLIQDRCLGRVTGLFVYWWDEEQKRYVEAEHLTGDRISWSEEEITVDTFALEQTGLSLRCRYVVDESGRVFLDPACEYVFSSGIPENVSSLQYPESFVVAFYHQYQDAFPSLPFFASDDLEVCDHGRCGCMRPPAEVEHVQVLDLDVMEERHYVSALTHEQVDVPHQAMITVKVRCTYAGGEQDPLCCARLVLVREEGGWFIEAVLDTPCEDEDYE